MSTNNEPVILYPKITRDGLNELLNLPDGVTQAITEIGLGRGRYIANANMTGAQDEILRVPVIDSLISGENAVQFYGIADNWTGSLTPVYEIIFYLASGTALAIYSNPDEAEAALIKGQPPELDYTLILDAIPADKLEVINTQRVFNPGMIAFMAESVTTQANTTLRYMETIDKLVDIKADHAADKQAAEIALQDAIDQSEQVNTAQSDALAALDEKVEQQRVDRVILDSESLKLAGTLALNQMQLINNNASAEAV